MAPNISSSQPSNEPVFRLVDTNPARVAKLFAVVIAIVVCVGTVANYCIFNVAPHPEHPIADVLKRFDLGHEPSIPSFYSASVLLGTAYLLLFLGRFDQSGGVSRRRNWYALSLLFLCLAIDEAALFHEMATAAIDQLGLSGPFYFSWIIPGLIFAIIVGLYFLRFLLSLNRRIGIWLFLSGVVFISGAVGMEFVAGLIFSNAVSEEEAMRSVSHVIVQACEEGLEMIGVAMFFCGLVDHLNSCGLQVLVRDNSPSETSPEAASAERNDAK